MPYNRDVNRREFLTRAAATAALGLSGHSLAAEDNPENAGRSVRIAVDVRRTAGAIPTDFMGLGYEISSVPIPGLLSSQNRTYVQLLRGLSPAGVIRIGGNTSDDSSFSATGQAVSSPKGTVVNQASLQQLGSFLDTTGWQLIWGLNLGSGSQQQAVEEAEAVVAAVKDKLLAFEIGNEPDLFGRGTAHRPSSYAYDDFLKEYRLYKAAIRAKLPHVRFAGPDAATVTDWVSRFAADEGNDLELLTHHYYRECAGPASTLDKLLHPDPKLAPKLETLQAASKRSRVPYRICETNSFCGGGKPGVSDTFGAALWTLDFMFALASAGCAGVNIETGVNQLGFISSYSPIGEDQHNAISAKPAYYGMLAFAQGSRGHRVPVDYDNQGVNLTAYAVAGGPKNLSITIINKDASLDANVHIVANGHLGNGRILRLSAPSLTSKEQITFGGASVAPNGEWKPSHIESLPSKKGKYEIHAPAGSACILQWGV